MRLRSLVVLCLVLLGATTARAQEAAIGVKAGVNFANIRFDEDNFDVSFDRRTGVVGGLFVVWPSASRLALQLEALYSQKGAKFDEEGVDGTVKIDYLDIPVLLRVSATPGAATSFHVFGGPSAGFRMRAHSVGTFLGESGDTDISQDVERMDFGLVAGAGVDVGRFTIDARHTWGMSNINKDTSDNLKVKNRVFAVMAGVRF